MAAQGPTGAGSTQAPAGIPVITSRHTPFPHCPQAPPRLKHTNDPGDVVLVTLAVVVVLVLVVVTVVDGIGGASPAMHQPLAPQPPITA